MIIIRRSPIGLTLVMIIAVLAPNFYSDTDVSKQSPGTARLILIVVMDGLRPDSINREDTPTIFRLREEGVNFINSHSVFPTVTRVNSAAISTGHYPDVNGLVSNSMFVPEVNPTRPINTSDYRQLLQMRDATEGRLLFVPS